MMPAAVGIASRDVQLNPALDDGRRVDLWRRCSSDRSTVLDRGLGNSAFDQCSVRVAAPMNTAEPVLFGFFALCGIYTLVAIVQITPMSSTNSTIRVGGRQTTFLAA
jgi:hypothetical protein